MFLGRTVAPGEPLWLPEDRDLVDMFFGEQRVRNSCGHYDWQSEDVAGLEPGYRACPMCAVMGPYRDKVQKQNRDRGADEHGLTFGWFPPREESDGN